MHFERQNAFQNALNYIFFPEKKLLKKKTSVPNLPCYPKHTHNKLFYLALLLVLICNVGRVATHHIV